MDFLLAVLLVWALAVVSPGPNFFLILRYSLIGRRSEALLAALGIAGGTFVWGVAGWLGIASLFKSFPELFMGIKLLGAAYLVFVGVKMLRAAIINRYAASITPEDSPPSLIRAFRSGAITNLSNPKTALFVSALFAAAMPEGISVWLGLGGALTMVAISIFWYGMVAFALTTPAVSRRAMHLRRWIDAFAGAAFLLFAGKLALSRG
ncbi:LysE family transporter [uncultured Cohaesibacter sp.]|uniref:LysE family transporter n=1 Tax=uncultured Cohaesibacter sp. TaxID=1002546 RepID=UPI0029C91E80|nr:LysE family transporter [uncultured Cohaesibacter sp.]